MTLHPRSLLLCGLLGLVGVLLGARASRAADDPAPAAPVIPATPADSMKGVTSVAAEAVPTPWPGAARADLAVPEALWARALAGVDRAGGPLGFSAEVMENYGRDTHMLRPIALLFRDVRAIPRFSVKVSDDLLAAAQDPAEVVRIAYALTDAVAARMFARPKGAEWGVAWLPATVAPGEALGRVFVRMGELTGQPAPVLEGEPRRSWLALPEPLQRLVVRVLVGSVEAAPWLTAAFDVPFLVAATGGRSAGDLSPARLQKLAGRPWQDEDPDPKDAAAFRASFQALERVDRDALCLGSVVYLLHLGVALSEWRTARAGVDLGRLGFLGFSVETPYGALRLEGSGDDREKTVSGSGLLTVDPWGSDAYEGRQAVPASPAQPISTILDLAGDDRSDGGDVAGTLGCGLFGLGAIVDLAGNDTYRVAESGLGCAWYGTGLVYDEAGNDRYEVRGKWGQGAAHVGAGVLVDLAGDDTYVCAQQSQGLGSTMGAGVLLDVAGNDAYTARDDGNREKIYLDQSVAMSQGCGYGRRADLGDGKSLAGGFGVLVDGAGDDRYHAQVWAQGAGYWWGVGLLEDRAGNDVYESGKYSIGAGAHFAIGCCVDLAGDDAYAGVTTSVNQFQGHARDGSIGISLDGDGNDRYRWRNTCGGAGDLCSVGLFWDRRGDDVYEVVWNDMGPANGWNETPPFGSATTIEPMRSFRDEVGNYGVFLDTGGTDAYRWDGPPRHAAKDATEWKRRNGPRSFGWGLDVEAYPKAAVVAPPK